MAHSECNMLMAPGMACFVTLVALLLLQATGCRASDVASIFVLLEL